MVVERKKEQDGHMIKVNQMIGKPQRRYHRGHNSD
jgi:hypothetical protein